jgi:hypothetical protein
MQKKRALSRSRDPMQLSNATIMTLPDERYRAVKAAQQFLSRLAGGEYPRVPKAVRDEARAVLRHYPLDWDMKRAAEAAPHVFQERMEDLHRFVLRGQQQDDSAAEDLVKGYREL